MKRIREFLKNHKVWIAISVALGLLGWMVYLRVVRGIGWAEWTGFGPPPTPNTARGKTLWDWLELLIVPIALAVGAWWLDHRQKQAIFV